MAEPLTWLLKLDSELGGATAFNKKLAEMEARLETTGAATSKAERAIESATVKASKMGKETAAAHAQGARSADAMGQQVAKASKDYVEGLMAAGVPMERIEHLGKILGGAGVGLASETRGHRAAGSAAGQHEDELSRLRDTLGALKRPGEISKLKGEIEAFGRPVPEVAREFKGVEHSIRDAKSGLKEFLAFSGALVAFEGLKIGIEMVSELGREIVKTASEEERMSRVFDNIAGKAGGAEAQEYAAKYAKNTEFSVGQTEKFAAALLKAGVPLEKLDMYMAAAGDVAAKSENKLEGMGAAVSALGKASLTGKISGRTVLGLGIGLPYMQELEEFRGKSDEELKGILEDGELTTNQVMRMIAGRDNVIGDHAVTMGKTLGATLTHLGELPEEYFKRFSNSPSFEALKDKLGNILEGLDPEGPRGARVFASLERTFGTVVSFVDEIDFEKWATVLETDVLPAVESVTGALKTTLQTVAQIIDGMRVAGRFVEHPIDTIVEAATGGVDLNKKHEQSTSVVGREMEGWWNAIKHPFEAIDYNLGIGKYSPGAGAGRAGGKIEDERFDDQPASGAANPYGADAVAGAVDITTGAPAERALRWVDKDLPDFERKGIDAATGFAAGMVRSEEPARAGAAMGMSALDGLSSPAGQDSHSPSRKFARLGGDAADGYVDGIEDGEERAVRAAAGMAAAAAGGGPGGDNDVSQPLFGRVRAGALTEPAPIAQPTRAAPAGDRKVEVNLSLVINMGSSAPRPREVDDMISKLRNALPGMLQPALESLAIEEGR